MSVLLAFRPRALLSAVLLASFATNLHSADAADPSLVAHWKLDETSGVAAADATGRGNSGTLTAAEWMPARIDGGLAFNGSGFMDCGNRAAVNPTKAVSLSAWVKSSDGAASATEVIVAKDGNKTVQYYLRIQSGGIVRFGAAGKVLSGSTVLVADTWHHLAGTYDGAHMNVYVNGALEGTMENSEAMTDTGGSVLIGSRSGDKPLRFMGVIDDVRIYDRALPEADIRALVAAAPALKTDGK